MKDKIAQIETMIRNGQGKEVQNLLLALDPKDLSRDEKLHVAFFARRVGLLELTIQLLIPYVRPKYETDPIATPDEFAEYACALVKLGLLSEASEILKQLKSKRTPQALLYLSFEHFARWDYQAAIPLLTEYLTLIDETYLKIVGSVNLSAALIFAERFKEAQDILLPLRESSRKSKLFLIEGYCSELLGQVKFETGELHAALDYFTEAENKLKASGGKNLFFVTKWKALVAFAEEAKKKNGVAGLAQLQSARAEAVTRHDYENVRVCDYYQGILSEDKNLCLDVFFGTPHEAFRNKIEIKTKQFLSIPEVFERYLSAGSQAKSQILDITRGELVHTGKAVKPGQVMHRLLGALASDAYRPLRSTDLFSLLFPGEYYNPKISVNRVHQAIARLREWFDTEQIPLEILEADSEFYLKNTGSIALRLNRHVKAQSILQPMIDNLKTAFADQSFNLVAASEKLQISERTLSRRLKEAVDSELVEKTGSGRYTTYKVRAS